MMRTKSLTYNFRSAFSSAIIVTVLLSSALLSGCGSASKDSDVPFGDSGSAAPEAEAPAAAPLAKEPTPAAPVPPKAQEAARGLLSGISDAIRSQNDEALFRASTQVLASNPNEVKALNAMGLYHFRKNRFLAAEYFFAKALKVQNNSDVLNNMAMTQLALGEKREAMKSLRKALEVNSNDGLAASNLGALYVAEKDYAKARVTLESAVRRGVKDPKTLLNYGIAQAAGGQFDSAKLMYEESLKANPNSPEALLSYAILLIEHLSLGQEGMKQLDRLRFMTPDETMKKRMIELENKAKPEIK